MILLISTVLANEDGKPGTAVSGCTCHGDPTPDTTLEITPDTLAVELGGVVNFDIVVRNATQVVAGRDGSEHWTQWGIDGEPCEIGISKA